MAADGPDLAGVRPGRCVVARRRRARGRAPTTSTGADLRWIAADRAGHGGRRLRGPWGRPSRRPDRLDGQDWWFRCRFAGPAGRRRPDGWVLELDGLATLADVWLNGDHLLHSESMFAAHAGAGRRARRPTTSCASGSPP